jgi:hypothetical protein
MVTSGEPIPILIRNIGDSVRKASRMELARPRNRQVPTCRFTIWYKRSNPYSSVPAFSNRLENERTGRNKIIYWLTNTAFYITPPIAYFSDRIQTYVVYPYPFICQQIIYWTDDIFSLVNN